MLFPLFMLSSQHRVHVLDPLRVDGAVEDEPLPLLGRHGGELAEVLCQDAVLPLLALEVTVHLGGGGDFFVPDVQTKSRLQTSRVGEDTFKMYLRYDTKIH